MFKRLCVITALAVVLAIPTMAGAWGRHFVKSLCEFPFGESGNFNVYFDQRNYHPSFFDEPEEPESLPNGGIK